MSTPHSPTDRETIFQRGLEAYRAGQHYEAHEFWEELWQDEEDDERRRFLQALIQIASAMHKILHDVGPRGSLRLLDRAIEWLDPLGDTYDGMRVAALRAGVRRCRDEIARLLEAGRHDLDRAFVPPIERAGGS